MTHVKNCCGESRCCVHDIACGTILLANNESQIIWENDTEFVMNGTIMVENDGTPNVSPQVMLSINGVPVGGFTVMPGYSRSITRSRLNLIEVDGVGGTGTTSVKISFSLNYKY